MIECDRFNKSFCSPCIDSITNDEIKVIKQIDVFVVLIMHVKKKSAIQAIMTDLEIEQRCNEYMERK